MAFKKHIATLASTLLVVASIQLVVSTSAQAATPCATGFTAVNTTECEWQVTSSGTIAIPAETYDVLAVGGGGGGGGTGAGNAGGGGGGQVSLTLNQALSGNYDIVIGAGGAGGLGATSNGGDLGYVGGDGSSTTVSQSATVLWSALGGKGGLPGAFLTQGTSTTGRTEGIGGNSGSGNLGGVAYWQDFPGGPLNNIGTGTYGGGGGAGDSSAGASGASSGIGGNGTQPVTGTFYASTRYFGGGGGGTGSSGGLGGGATGGIYLDPAGFAGTANTGGGGGAGGGGRYSANPGGAGGSGVVIVRYDRAPKIPPAPTVVAGDTQVTVTPVAAATSSFRPATSYIVTAYLGGSATAFNCTVTLPSTSCPITGLTNGTAYTFVSAAINADGTSAASVESGPATPVGAAVAPGTPGTPNAIAGNGQASIDWTAPTTGTAPFSYTVTSNPAGGTCTVTGLTAVCTGLTNGVSYTFTVTATNGTLPDATSLSSNSVTPSAGGSGTSPDVTGTEKPLEVDASQVTITPGIKSLNINVNWSGYTTQMPSSYTVTLNPGGATCTIQGAQSSCDILGLTPGVEYSVSIVAHNQSGSSAAWVSSRTYQVNRELVPASTSKLVVSSFAVNKATLTSKIKRSIRAFLISKATLIEFTCTGYTAGKPVLRSDRALAKARAAAVCDYIEKLRPTAITTVVAKTPGLAFGAKNRKVVILGYQPAN
jgi:titin